MSSNPLAAGAVRARHLTTRLLDQVPGARRTLADLVRVEVIDRMMSIAAQALLALVPLFIVLAAFLPFDIGSATVERVQDLMGIQGSASESVAATLSPEQVRTQTGLFGLLVTLASAISFAKALQRMHERVWEMPHMGGMAGTRRCFLWLLTWLIYLQAVALADQVLTGDRVRTSMALLTQLALGTLVWWWSARALLLNRIRWSQLWCGALLTAIATTVVAQASNLVMPAYADANVAQFGAFGLIFAMASWLIAFAGVMIVATVLGRVLTEDPHVLAGVHTLQTLALRITSRPPSRSE